VAVRRPRILVDYQVQVSEPKTAKGRRSLALDPVTVVALRAHRARQAEEKLAVGGRYRDSELVFTGPDGTAVHPRASGAVLSLVPAACAGGRAAEDQAA
jgi:hypothetical protein